MMLSEMIKQLQEKYEKLGDVPVLITDGYKAEFYSGQYDIIEYTDQNQTYVDIGIGGCNEE